jgi:hypothetical protein
MNPRSYPWMIPVLLATAFAACAHDERPRHGAPAQSDSSYFDASQGGPVSVVIDGRTYTGIAQQVVTGSAVVYKALLTPREGGSGLRCDFVEEGRRRLNGTCIDENQRLFPVVVAR